METGFISWGQLSIVMELGFIACLKVPTCWLPTREPGSVNTARDIFFQVHDELYFASIIESASVKDNLPEIPDQV